MELITLIIGCFIGYYIGKFRYSKDEQTYQLKDLIEITRRNTKYFTNKKEFYDQCVKNKLVDFNKNYTIGIESIETDSKAIHEEQYVLYEIILAPH